MAWYTDFKNALTNYPWKSMLVIGTATTFTIGAYYIGKWRALREPVVDSVVLTRDLDGDGKGPDAGVILSNGRAEGVYIQEDGRTLLSHQGMFKKFKGLDGIINTPRRSPKSGKSAPANPLDEQFNLKDYFTPQQVHSTIPSKQPLQSIQPLSPEPTKSIQPSLQPPPIPTPQEPSLGSPSNYTLSPTTDRTAYISSELEKRAEIELQPVRRPLVPIIR